MGDDDDKQEEEEEEEGGDDLAEKEVRGRRLRPSSNVELFMCRT